LCDIIWKPFLFKGLEETSANARQVLETLSRMYAKVLPEEESAWRNLTYKGLDATFASETDPGVLKAAVDRLANILEPLLTMEKMPKFREELERILRKAVAIWNDMRIDRMRMSVSASPLRDVDQEQDGWKTPPTLDLGHLAAPTNNKTEKVKSWCLFPRIEVVSAERLVLFPGYALFSDSPVFAQGLLEKQEIKERFEQMCMSSLNSPPTSPISERSPGLGTG